MILRPPLDVATYLDANSTSLTLGTNLFIGPVRSQSDAIPVECVFVVGTWASPPERLFGTAPEIRHPVVTTAVRSASYDTGNTLARAIYAILQSATPPGYMDVVCQQSGPSLGDYDKNNFYLFVNDWQTPYDSAKSVANFLLPWQLT